MQDLSFIAIDKNGKRVKYKTIATYEADNNKNYIIYTDNTYDKNGKLKLYYSMYIIVDNKMQLLEITLNEDRKIALELIKELVNDNN